MPERTFDEKRKARMDSPERRTLLPQDYILSLLHVQENDVIIDIGAGAGYFTFPLAKQTTNTVYALDIEQDMLDYIEKQAKEQDTQNLMFLHESIEHIPLENQSIDRALASMVLHEIQPLAPALQEIYRILTPGGRFVIIDWIPEPNDTRANRINSGDMQRAAEQAGFVFDVLTTPSNQVYAIACDKPKQDV